MIYKKKLEEFFKLVENQFVYGGKKYPSKFKDKEATDVLCDSHGYRGLFWAMNKYIFRFRNLKLEKEMLKLSCFCYIIWLKRGFFVLDSGINDPIIYTNIQLKSDNFEKFKKFIIKNNKSFVTATGNIKDEYSIDDYLDSIEQILIKWSDSNKQWKNILAVDIDRIFINSFYIWTRLFGNELKHNEDIGK